MIGEAFDGKNWGTNRKASQAARDRMSELYVEGYKTYGLHKESLNGNKTYFVFAFDDAEDHQIMPRNPGAHPHGRRLNFLTIHIGMKVAVETTTSYAHPWHAKRGTVKSVTLTNEGVAWAMVKFDNATPKGEPGPPPEAGLEVHLLRQVAK